MNLKDQVAVVTGIEQGTGKTAALDFAQAGADVALIDFNPRIIAETATEIASLGQRVLPICTNMLEWKEIKAAMAQVVSEFSRIDILFNNMDVTETMGNSYVDEPDLDWDLGWNWMVGDRLKAVFFSCKAVLDTMRAQNYGRIINVAPIQKVNVDGRRLPYSVSKAGVIDMTKNLANEVGGYDIRVNAVVPADIEMPIFGDKAYQSLAPIVASKGETVAPELRKQGKRARHLETIQSVLPLFTEASTFVTGYCHEVSGAPPSINPWGVRGIPKIDEDGAALTIEYMPSAYFSNWADVLHGGVISTLLDEAMCLVGMASFKNPTFTASLEIRFLKPAPTHTELIISAHRTKMSRKLINAEASLALEDGTICATGKGKVLIAA
ncbi:hypothetical protein C6503_03410 [Candidatus Poribacteria bacterium]|nr:MAG: hypothetical protein C6503_03410 [Candidatus Poribacteria bacterium]